jgi:hypothetical protein
VAPKNAEVHLAPADGLQTYSQPYPRFIEGDASGPLINAGEQLNIAAVQGTWVQVSTPADGVLGWVDGRKLIPPVNPPVRMAAATTTQMPAPATSSTPTVTLTAGTIVGIIASLGIVLGAALHWLHSFFSGVTSFDIPVQFLFDNHTRSSDPNIGIFLVALGIAGLLLSLFARGAIWRVLIGILAIAIAAAFFIQIAEALSGSSRSFTDVTGAGPWVTGVAGLLLMVSTVLN